MKWSVKPTNDANNGNGEHTITRCNEVSNVPIHIKNEEKVNILP